MRSSSPPSLNQEDRKELDASGIIQLLEEDTRLAFVVRREHTNPVVHPVYINPALNGAHNLKAALYRPQGFPSETPNASPFAFLQWVGGAEHGSRRAAYGNDWTAVCTGRWKVIYGRPNEGNGSNASSPRTGSTGHSCTGSLGPSSGKKQTAQKPRNMSVDYTIPHSYPNASSHVRFFWETDWAATELGAMNTWSKALRHEVNQLMADPRPTALCWGESRIMMYNEPYIPVAGKMHPRCMGISLESAWAEAYQVVKPLFDKALETGEPSMNENTMFFVERNGFTEEAFFTWYIIPIRGEQGFPGFYLPVYETTRQNFADRQMATLLLLGQLVASSRDIKEYWLNCLKGLEPNTHDIPFAALYSLSTAESPSETIPESDSVASEYSSTTGSKFWDLEGVLGLDESVLPSRIDSDEAAEQLTSEFRSIVKAGQNTMLSITDGTFPTCLVGNAPSRGVGDQCISAMIIPIGPSTREKVLGFLVVGINPRRAFNHDYEHFIQLLGRQLATSMASIVLIEEETRRNKIAGQLAAQDRIRLSSQLAVASAQAEESELRFRKMADRAPVSLFHVASDGMVLYANDLWFELTGHSRDTLAPFSWYEMLHEDDHPIVDHAWAMAMAGEAIHVEVRLKKPFVTQEIVNGEQVAGESWVSADAYTLKNDKGIVTSILGCLSDISHHKWILAFQERRKEEALEMKRIQENFIDMTSHEMRNPLSAIILCGDSIALALDDAKYKTENGSATISAEELRACADAANTIVLCGQHQKRIIDDVLTLSKLDAGLLLITPIESQPATMLEQALKMFDGQLIKSKIEMKYTVDPSYKQLNIDWVLLDPSRLTQVLINLMTNAIKFTQAQKRRRIEVTISGASKRPSDSETKVKYIASDKPQKSLPESKDVPDEFFIVISVEDTGVGLSEHEMNVLFQRFSQASAKTHVHYGGSGLGLFISRQLTELQGGQIGVSSKVGVGSRFEFYCHAVRCSPPKDSCRSEFWAADVPPGAGDKTLAKSLKRKRETKHILLVEDNLVNQRVMAKQLKQAGYNVVVANHGAEALDRIRETALWSANSSSSEAKPLDCILLDVEMPVMDGLTCAREIRKLQEDGKITHHIHIIAISANARLEQQADAKNAGMDSVVTKPFRLDQLTRELDRV